MLTSGTKAAISLKHTCLAALLHSSPALPLERLVPQCTALHHACLQLQQQEFPTFPPMGFQLPCDYLPCEPQTLNRKKPHSLGSEAVVTAHSVLHPRDNCFYLPWSQLQLPLSRHATAPCLSIGLSLLYNPLFSHHASVKIFYCRLQELLPDAGSFTRSGLAFTNLTHC